MKYLIVLLVVALMIWLARAGKRAEKVKAERAAAEAARARAVAHDLMVACAQCGVHLPKADAVIARGQVFCCEAHRVAHERATAPR